MTIRKQFTILILAIITIPLLCAIFILTYEYTTNPERQLLHGARKFVKPHLLHISEEEWLTLHKELHKAPPDIEVSIVVLGNDYISIAYSTIKELHTNTKITQQRLFDFMQSTTGKYLYQFDAYDFKSTDQKVALISKQKKDKTRSSHMNVAHYVLISLVFFALTVIFIIISLSQTIFSSISDLEKSASRILSDTLEDSLDASFGKILESNLEHAHAEMGENEITLLFNHFKKIHKELLRAQKNRFNFIMGMSHDLRTPIAVIKGYIEAIQENVIYDKDELQDAFRIIESKTDLLESRIDTLLNFVKLENTHTKKTMTIENICELLKDFFKNVSSIGNVLNRNVIQNFAIEKETRVRMDKALFHRALENIFYNAIRYSKDGSTIFVKAEEINASIHISIKDEGIGIDEKDKKNIFLPLFRASHERSEEGMGIGLSVVKSIVDAHNWKIKVDSQKGVGTTFTIIIPLEHDLNN